MQQNREFKGLLQEVQLLRIEMDTQNQNITMNQKRDEMIDGIKGKLNRMCKQAESIGVQNLTRTVRNMET